MDESVDDAAAQLRLWISAPEKAQYDGLTEEEARILDVVKEATGGSPLHQLLLVGRTAVASSTLMPLMPNASTHPVFAPD